MTTDVLPPVSRSATSVALATALILAVPLVAMQFTDEVQWSFRDFIIMGALLFGAGMSFVLLTRSRHGLYRVATGLGVAAGLLLTWVNLAVGIVMDPPHRANLMYFGILALGGVIALTGRFTPRAMVCALSVTAAGIGLAAATVLLGGFDPPGIKGDFGPVLLLHGFFAVPFAASAALFALAARRQRAAS